MNTCSFVNIIKNSNELDLSFYSFESSEIRSGRLMHHSPYEINVPVKYFQNVEISSNRQNSTIIISRYVRFIMDHETIIQVTLPRIKNCEKVFVSNF